MIRNINLNFVEKTIRYENKDIPYLIQSSIKAKRIKISIKHTGQVVLTKPFFMRESVAENFLQRKIVWVLDKLRHFSDLIDLGISKFTKKDYQKHKINALKLCTEKVNFFNEYYKLSYNHISIKNQISRWGSCSSKKNLNYNYKILFLPEELQNYLIVHELCHLREMNHSRAFWSLVKITIPDYKELNRKLKQCLK